MREVELPNDCILVFEVSKCWQVRATIGQRQGSVGIVVSVVYFWQISAASSWNALKSKTIENPVCSSKTCQGHYTEGAAQDADRRQQLHRNKHSKVKAHRLAFQCFVEEAIVTLLMHCSKLSTKLTPTVAPQRTSCFLTSRSYWITRQRTVGRNQIHSCRLWSNSYLSMRKLRRQ